MNRCLHEESIEDLVLWSERDAALEAHLETCARCLAALEAISEERALFLRRAPLVPPPPVTVPSPSSPACPPRFAPLLALVACAAALLGLVLRPPGAETATDTAPSFEEPRVSQSLATMEQGKSLASELLPSTDQCVVPDRATCEERVTSSLATP